MSGRSAEALQIGVPSVDEQLRIHWMGTRSIVVFNLNAYNFISLKPIIEKT